MQRSNKLIKDSTIYAVSTFASQTVGIFTSIAMRRFLTLEMMGTWTTFLVVLNYALFFHMGVFLDCPQDEYIVKDLQIKDKVNFMETLLNLKR